jgi:outer membrane protein TolC
MLPDLTLQVAWTRTSESGAPADIIDNGTDSWWVGLGSAGDRSRSTARREHQQRLLAVEEARRAYAARREQIASQVRRELAALARLGERIPANREALSGVEGQLELARVRFRHGLAGIEDLLEAENRLSQSRLELVSAGFDSAVGIYRLRAALGTLLAAAPDAAGTP